MILMAIDPGASGGICWIDNDQLSSGVKAIGMPDTDTAIVELFEQFKGKDVTVLMEMVTGFVGFRTKRVNIVCPRCKGYVPYEVKESDPAARSFNFGKNYGKLEGIIAAMKFRVEKPIVARSWQKVHGLSKPKCIAQNKWKNILKDRAQKLFPSVKVTLKTADALLILDVLMRMQNKHNPNF